MTKKEKEARRLLRLGKFREAVDKLNEAGNELRHSGDIENAVKLLEEGSKIAREHQKYLEGSICERSLCELYADEGMRESCLRHLVQFHKLAKQSQNRTQEQVSYHVEAHCYLQLFSHEKADTNDIKKALELTKKSRELVDLYEEEFKKEKDYVSARSRRVHLTILEAQLHNQLRQNETAKRLLNKALSLTKPSERSQKCEIYRTMLSVVDVNERIQIAELMDNIAPEDRKAQTLLELSHQHFLGGNLRNAYKKLTLAYFSHRKQIGSDLNETIKRLCIIWRLVEYTKILKNPSREPKISLCELYEAIGDLYDQYYQTMMSAEKKEYTQFVKHDILKNYEKMLEHKRNDGDVLRAYLAMALVNMDLDQFEKAKKCFEDRLDLLIETGASDDKILDARVSIFNCECKMNFPNLESKFEKLKSEVTRSDIKRELFDIWSNYWSDQGNTENEEKWKAEVKAIPDVMVKNEDDQTDVKFYRMTNDTILEKCKEDNKLMELDSWTDHQKTKTNQNGETELHVAAQNDDNAFVEKLCRIGCNVNAKDNGGWTPLSEAVGHNQFENVRILIHYGADLNARSTQPLISDESQGQSSDDAHHYGLTPLMDACTNGFIEIAELLVKKGANIQLKDSKGWTSYQHLVNHIKGLDLANDSTTKFAEYLKNLTETHTKIPLSPVPPRPILPPPPPQNESDDSSPEDDERILGMAASRKRRNSNNSENFGNISKRKQRTDPSPLRPLQKRPTPSPSFFEPKRKHHNSSSSLNSLHRSSLSPSRRSISPTCTIRSAPIGGGRDDDDVQIVGVRRSGGNATTNSSPRIRPPVPPIRPQIPPPSPIQQQNTDIVVKCCFENPNSPDEPRPPLKLPMNRNMSISEVKAQVMSKMAASQLMIRNILDQEKAELGESILLSHIAEPNQREISLVFQLSAPPADVVYKEKSKDPISEVTDRLKLLSTENRLDLSNLFLDSQSISDVTNVFKTSEKPKNCQINLSFCELSLEDESNLQSLLDECSHLIISNSQSKNGFSALFDKPKNCIQKLEIMGIEFRDESQMSKIVKMCPNLKFLNLSSIKVSFPTADPLIPSILSGIQNLKSLDLSFNSTWISDDFWREILRILNNLEELKMNETKSDVQFESDWLPKLTSFCARGSDLEWDSIFELFSVLEKINSIDVRFSTISSSLPEELRNIKPILHILF